MENLRTLNTQELTAGGPITFARFMQSALYCPKLGFYERDSRKVGREGAFVTSVSIGPLLGQLLAFQFARWLENISGNEKMLVESGAHEGDLALDILNHLAKFEPELYQRCRYGILEPSDVRRKWQAKNLRDHLERIVWWRDWNELPESSLSGIIFSNEFLDAFPVHKLAWNAMEGRWFEWGVKLLDNDFAWTAMDISEGTLLDEFGVEIPPRLESVLPDGYVLEVSPQAGQWWRRAASALKEGILMTLDYGWEAIEFLKPERTHGTLRGYRNHRSSLDLLSHVGEQDLTAHVNFTQLKREGARGGLVTRFQEPQSKFLSRILTQTWQRNAPFPLWNDQMKRQFQTLSHPDHFGHSFTAFAQCAGPA